MRKHRFYDRLKNAFQYLCLGIGISSVLFFCSVPAKKFAFSIKNYIKFGDQADPRNLLYVSPGTEIGYKIFNLEELTENPTVLHTGDDSFAEQIINDIQERVKREGTLKEIVIYAHGNSLFMTSLDDRFLVGKHWRENKLSNTKHQNTDMFIGKFLDKLAWLNKKLGKKITDRIVFAGCNTFSCFSNDEVEAYRAWAKRFGVEIVGAIGPMWGATGEFVQFTPNGSVIKDRISASAFNPFLLIPRAASRNDNEYKGWINCHLGKTQQEGKACYDDSPFQNVSFRGPISQYLIAISDPDRPLPSQETVETKKLTHS